MKFKGRMAFLTTEMAKKWKYGRLKYAYTNYYPKVKWIYAVSGNYLYVIKLDSFSGVVAWSEVPDCYKKYLNKKKNVFRTKAKLIKIIKRDLRRG